MPKQIKQHSKLWNKYKKRFLGANDCASLLGYGFEEPSDILCQRIDQTNKEITDRMEKGIRYESVVRDLCAKRNGITIVDSFMVTHKDYTWLKVSPDGYCPEWNCLIEFKVKHELTEKIPLKYWIQMQLQMEVEDKENCLYCENVIREYKDIDEYNEENPIPDPDMMSYNISNPWKLVSFREKMVTRNRDWFKNNISIIEKYWKIIESERLQRKPNTRANVKRKNEDTNTYKYKTFKAYIEEKESIVMPYMFNNYVLDDPVLDWYNLYGDPTLQDKEASAIMSLTRERGRCFNELVIKYITYNVDMPSINIDPTPSYSDDNIALHDYKYSYEHIIETAKAINDRIPIIFNAYLKGTYNDTVLGGKADMLILEDMLPTLLGILDTDNEFIDMLPTKKSRCPYVIVSFKYSTINLLANKEGLLNNSKQKAYKGQMWGLNTALGAMMETEAPKVCYVFGRRYDYKHRNTTFIINEAFNAIGVIDYSGWDLQYVDKCNSALKWLKKVQGKDQDACKWDPLNPECIEMYPNMKNSRDFPWHGCKVRCAEKIKDITKMYKCGVNIRNYAHDKGITEWSELSYESIGCKSPIMLKQIMNFIDANIGAGSRDLSNINFSTKNKVPCVEFFVDFESITNIYDSFESFPEATNSAMVFLVGMITVDNVTGERKYKAYRAKTMTTKDERYIIDQMLLDMKEAREKYDQDYSPMYFWSFAEKYLLTKAITRNVMDENKLLLIDLCYHFKQAGVALEGMFGYGLKHVAKILHDAGMIKTIWSESSNIKDGISAMVEAIKAYNDVIHDKEIFKNIVEYNYIDCKVIEEIVGFIRGDLAHF